MNLKNRLAEFLKRYNHNSDCTYDTCEELKDQVDGVLEICEGRKV